MWNAPIIHYNIVSNHFDDSRAEVKGKETIKGVSFQFHPIPFSPETGAKIRPLNQNAILQYHILNPSQQYITVLRIPRL